MCVRELWIYVSLLLSNSVTQEHHFLHPTHAQLPSILYVHLAFPTHPLLYGFTTPLYLHLMFSCAKGHFQAQHMLSSKVAPKIALFVF